ncbi:response regulator transcription factor [Spartinivicinus poritis]|uniref:Response regulator transcription factor n=1 Tax=Spartinivicinus poritis TaxID=2994640 RepID=A0ABT5UEX5_9GAMM|nr:response regulator transcription factor [Spartinivicinus sp. A2-2]MDE1464023.1 response regulator transcription factor [Spartinivicinus sp. A2-2]
MNILLLEDDELLSKRLNELFYKNKYHCNKCYTLDSVDNSWTNADIAILSLDLLGDSYFSQIACLLTLKAIPIIILSHSDETEHRINSFRAGARGFLVKPVYTQEIIAIAQMLLRPIGESEIIYKDLKINLSNNVAYYKNEQVCLSRKEIKLLAFLASHPSRLCNRDEILKQVWGYNSLPSTRTVDNHILSIRKKVPELKINTVRGVGYQLEISE